MSRPLQWLQRRFLAKPDCSAAQVEETVTQEPKEPDRGRPGRAGALGDRMESTNRTAQFPVGQSTQPYMHAAQVSSQRAGYRYDTPHLPKELLRPPRPAAPAARWLCYKPHVASLASLLSPADCRLLIEHAQKQPLYQVAPRTWRNWLSMRPESLRRQAVPLRTQGPNDVVGRISLQLAATLQIDPACCEPLKIRHYLPGDKMNRHHDYFTSAVQEKLQGRQRRATLLVYLNDVAAGGETRFPQLGLQIQPRMGGGLYFEYTNRHGENDPCTVHSSRQLKDGEKWVATLFIHNRPRLSGCKI